MGDKEKNDSAGDPVNGQQVAEEDLASVEVNEELIEVSSELNELPVEAEVIGTDAEEDYSEVSQPDAKKIKNAKDLNGSGKVKDLIFGPVRERAQRANDKLRSHLSGTILLSLTDSSEKYHFSWKSKDIVITEGAADSTDCTIEIGSSDLLGIADGALNAQIAILSHKIKISGKMNSAVYFFNLFAPPNK
jgi:putative sterol carrier protein